MADRNPDLLLDPDNGMYNPSEALNVIHKLTLDGKATPEERTKLQAKAADVLARIQADVKDLEGRTDNGRKELETELAEVKTAMAKVDPADTAKLGMFQSYVDSLTKTLESSQQTAEDPALKAKIKEANKRLSDAQAIYDSLLQENTGKSDVSKLVAQANSVADAADQAAVAQSAQAAKQVVVLSMASPGAVSPVDARALANNKDNSLTDQERDYLASYADASEAVENLKTIKQVQKEVLYGDKKLDQKGLVQYQERVGSALSSGAISRVVKELQGLAKFQEGHRNKLAAIEQAFAEFRKTGKAVQMVKDGAGKWAVSPLSMSPDDVRAQKGLVINHNSMKLVEAVRLEAGAIDKMQKALSAAFSVKMAEARGAAAPAVPTAPATADAPVQAKQKKEAKPKAPKPVLTAEEKALADAEKQRRRVERSNPRSLYQSLKNALGDADLNDIYGSEWKKRFTSLKNSKSPRVLMDMVTSGELDDFLPANMRFGTGQETGLGKEKDAEEYIKERLRNRDYLTEDTKDQLAQIGVTIEQIEQTVSTKEAEDELARIEQQLAEQQPEQPDEQPAEQAGDVGQDPTAPVAEAEGNLAERAGSEADLSGKLTALLDAKNPLSAWLKQAKGGEGAASVRPLVAVKNFLTACKADETLPSKYLKEDINESQEGTLRAFLGRSEAFAAEVNRLLDQQAPQFRYQNPIEDLMTVVDGKVQFDENITTAMQLAGETWLADKLAKGLLNDDKAINSILGREDDADVSELAYTELTDVGARYTVVANTIGSKVFQALGVKVSDEASVSLMPRMQAAMGALVLEAMINQGLLKETKVPGEVFKELTGSDDTVVYADPVFVNVANVNGQVAKSAEMVKNSMAESKNVLEKLFSVEPGMKAPSFKPMPFKQDKAKSSVMGVPKFLAKVLGKKNQEENRVDQDIFRVVAAMTEANEDLVIEMAGGEMLDGSTQHVSRHASIKAKREGLQRELRNFLGFVSSEVLPQGMGTPFFFEHNVWANQRVGILNNLINPQSSKMHRYMLFRPSWQTEVDTTNDADMENFKLRVMEGLGVKTDKQANVKSLEKWQATVGTPEIEAAV